jgi:hypothetical protein
MRPRASTAIASNMDEVQLMPLPVTTLVQFGVEITGASGHELARQVRP